MPTEPSYLKDNPWKDILKQRGKDSGHQVLTKPDSPTQRRKPQAAARDQLQSAAKKRGGPPRSKAVIAQRRKKVLELYLRGVDAEAIATQLTYPARTIYKDLEHLKEWLKIHFERDRVAITNKAMAQLDMLWRDLQQIYFSPIPLEGQDPAYRKVMTIDRMLRVLQLRTYLSGTSPAQTGPASTGKFDTSKMNEDEQVNFARAIVKLEATARQP